MQHRATRAAAPVKVPGSARRSGSFWFHTGTARTRRTSIDISVTPTHAPSPHTSHALTSNDYTDKLHSKTTPRGGYKTAAAVAACSALSTSGAPTQRPPGKSSSQRSSAPPRPPALSSEEQQRSPALRVSPDRRYDGQRAARAAGPGM